jgi:electron transfer flavoprotein alpha subunit
MKEILVLAEHRRGQIREITFEILTKGRELASKIGGEVTAVLFGKDVREFAKALSEYAERVLLIEDDRLANFNSEAYQGALQALVAERKPILALVGHTSFGVDLAPSLSVALNLPLVTDCIDLQFEDDVLTATRQMYGGKVNVKVVLRKAETYLATVRQATFPPQNPAIKGEVVETPSPLFSESTERRFIEYVMPPPGGVDITASDVLVGIGRGIKDEEEISSMEELATKLGGALACSRPIVDKGWLPTDRQVGSSGKTVKPKLYVALGISGAFQHVLGMKNSDLIIAVNKDANAPIFSVADYGVVDDLFKIVPPLKAKLDEMK